MKIIVTVFLTFMLINLAVISNADTRRCPGCSTPASPPPTVKQLPTPSPSSSVNKTSPNTTGTNTVKSSPKVEHQTDQSMVAGRGQTPPPLAQKQVVPTNSTSESLNSSANDLKKTASQLPRGSQRDRALADSRQAELDAAAVKTRKQKQDNQAAFEERTKQQKKAATVKGKNLSSNIPKQFKKSNGGANEEDFITPHSRRHKYDSQNTSTSSKTQFGKDVNIRALREDTMRNGQSKYDSEHGATTYSKSYGFNISTSDTPTGEMRVKINHNKPHRSTQFPYYPRAGS